MIGPDALTFEPQICSDWTLSDGSTVDIEFYLPCLNLHSSIPLELETYPPREFSIHYVLGSRLARLDSACVIVSVEEIVYVGLKDVRIIPCHRNFLSYHGPAWGNRGLADIVGYLKERDSLVDVSQDGISSDPNPREIHAYSARDSI